jgi:thioesterase domain-containing protein
VSLEVLVAEHGIEVDIEYDSALFDVSTISRMADEYLSILGCVARDPQRTLSQVLVARLEEKPEVPSQLGSRTSAEIATTIEGLVQTIRSEGIEEGHSLVPLRQESTGKPLFCIHGLGGHVAAFLPLAKSLPHPRPVFGLQAIGLEGETRPHDKIETMAGWYVEEIRRQQRTGPYLLCGWSMGGWIAAEVARQLRAAGQETSLIAMFDTHMHFRDFETPGVDDNAVLRWLAPRLQLDPREMQGLPLDRQWDLIAKRAEGAIGLGAEEIRNLAEVCRVQIAAATAYRPEPYDGEVILYRAQRQRGGLDPRWHTLFPKLRVEQVTGSHYTMLQLPHVTTLAESLDRHLIRAAGVNTKGQDR